MGWKRLVRVGAGNSQEELLGTSWDSAAGTPKAVKPSSGRAPDERASSGARHSSSSRRRRPRVLLRNSRECLTVMLGAESDCQIHTSDRPTGCMRCN